MKYSKNSNYEHNNENYTYLILSEVFNIRDNNTLFINLYGNARVRIKDAIIEVYESAFSDLDGYSMWVNQDYINVSNKQCTSEQVREYLKALIYNSREDSFQILCNLHFNLQLFYSRLTKELVCKLSKFIRSYLVYDNNAELRLTCNYFQLTFSLNPLSKPLVEIGGTNYSLTDDNFITVLEQLI